MIKKNFILFFCLVLLNNCGFKVVKNNFQNFNIVEIKTSGESKINYLLKSNLKRDNKKNNNKNIYLDIKTNKQRNIREKNIKNVITKYQMVITSEVSYRSIDGNTKGNFTVKTEGDYEVDKQYSRTINNEKNLVTNLADEIAEEIINNIRIIINDS